MTVIWTLEKTAAMTVRWEVAYVSKAFANLKLVVEKCLSLRNASKLPASDPAPVNQGFRVARDGSPGGSVV